MDYVVECAVCGQVETIKLPEDGYFNWMSGMSVQEAFPELNSFEREALISNWCFDCISGVFHRPKPGDNSFGKLLGECECCGCGIWEKDFNNTKEAYVCNGCHTRYILTEDGELKSNEVPEEDD